MRDLGEAAALVRVEVDVVNVQRRRHQSSRRNALLNRVRGVLDRHTANRGGGVVPLELVEGVELEPDLDLVVLEGNQRERQARVAAEPELERDVQGVLGGALAHLLQGVRLTGRAVIVAVLAALHQQVGQLRHVANHLGVAGLLARLLGQLIPDVQPVAIVLVDALAANLNLNVLDEIVADPVEPAELGTRAVGGGAQGHAGQGGLQVHAVDQVTVALDGASHLAAEPRRAVEGVLNGLHREVGVAAVHHLEESNLGIAR